LREAARYPQSLFDGDSRHLLTNDFNSLWTYACDSVLSSISPHPNNLPIFCAK
jgi:hypothetical protein